MKRTILSFFFIFIYITNISSAEDAKITVLSTEKIPGKVTPLLFGSFLEFLNDFINGDFGMWSQELENRGFDISSPSTESGLYWYTYSTSERDTFKLLRGGYNPNGTQFQRLIKTSDNGSTGICQNVYVSDTVGNNFYCYLKSVNTPCTVVISLTDTNSGSVYFTSSLLQIDTVWAKYNITTPPVVGSHRVRLMISLEGTGTVDVDEASFMPANNVKGIRQEFYQLFKEWGPGIVRYPGGGFADIECCHLDYSIGEIDHRTSGDCKWGEYQRMDFGTDEFIEFCKDVGAEPHIVVNLATGTPEEAANWVEYCNGSIDTEYGALRAKNGHKEPYNVKYWEIGNEQWSNPFQMSQRYVVFYDSMIKVDPTIKVMIDGNLWGGKEYLDTLLMVAGDKVDFYSYHNITFAYPRNVVCSDTQMYKHVVGTSTVNDDEINRLTGWINEAGYGGGKIKLALTEYIIDYGIKPIWIDTVTRNSSLEAGLWMAGCLNSYARNSDKLEIFEKTFGLGHIRGGYNSKGERIFYPSPIHTVLSFYRNHCGENVLPFEDSSQIYNPVYCEGMLWVDNVPYLDIAVTEGDSIVYLSVVNTHWKDSIKTTFNFPFPIPDYPVKLHEMYDNDFLRVNTPDFPNSIKIETRDFLFKDSTYSFPPHSFTIMEFSLRKKQDTVVNRFVISPNPANDYININKPSHIEDGILTVSIYNSLGGNILSTPVNFDRGSTRIDISGLSQGFYFINITGNGINHTEKFIKAIDN